MAGGGIMIREKEIEKMGKALRKKHPECGYISIDYQYQDYSHKTTTSYWWFYVEGIISNQGLSWQELKALVAEHLKGDK